MNFDWTDHGAESSPLAAQDYLAAWIVSQAHTYSQAFAQRAWSWVRGRLGKDWTLADLAAWRDATAEASIPVWGLAEMMSLVPGLVGLYEAEVGKDATTESVEDALPESLGAPDAELPVTIEAPRLWRPGQRFRVQGISSRRGPQGPILQPDKANALLYATMAAAEKCAAWADAIRDDLRWEIVQGIREDLTLAQVRGRLFDRFEAWGADFRRIAVTEMAESHAAGRLLGWPEGAKIRMVVHKDACEDCKRLFDNGKRVFTVRHTPGDEQTEMWPGKTNVGRKREDWIPAIPVHPNERCTPVLAEPPSNWMQA